MSSKETRARREKEWIEEQERADAERYRKDNLSMWARIEELNVDDSLKKILHLLAEASNLEPPG